MWTYDAFGLRIGSTIALPELSLAAAQPEAPDAVVTIGALEERLDGARPLEPLMQVATGRFQLNAPAGRYRVLGGREIIVDPAPGASARDVRLHVLGTALGALLHQRGAFPLHAATVAWRDGAVAFAGPSGAGKSTLAAQLLARDWTILADDLCVIDLDPAGRPRVHVGARRIKLWPDSPAMGEMAGRTIGAVADGLDKVAVTLAPDTGARLLRRVYILRPESEGCVVIQSLGGAERLSAVLAETYRWSLAVASGQAARHFSLCQAACLECDIFELRYAHDVTSPTAVVDAVLGHLKE